MKGLRRAIAFTAVAACCSTVGCAREPESHAIVRGIVHELAAQRYAVASSRYRAYEDTVLEADAAPAWRRALEHDDPTVRQWAVDALWRIGLPEDVDLLVAALDDPFRKVGEAAASGLIQVAPDVARAELLDRLDSTDPDVVTLAIRGLGELGDTSVVPDLVALLENPALQEPKRAVVAEVLGSLADPSAADALVRVALDGSLGPQLRRLAAEAALSVTSSGPGADDVSRALRGADDPYIVALAEGIDGD